MRKIALIVIVSVTTVVAFGEASAAVHDVSGPVEEATVYRDRAQVTKVVRRELGAAEHQLRVPLPDRVVEGSLRVYSDNETTINTFRVETETVPRSPTRRSGT